MRLLVVDGYDRPGREDLAQAGCTLAGQLYSAMLRRADEGVEVDIVHPADADSELPSGAGLADYDGIAWTGSSLTVYKDGPRVRRQIDLARTAFEARVPSFGSCWAVQIAVTAAGGTCHLNPNGREFGLARKIGLNDAGRAHPLYTGKKAVFDGFTSHFDEVAALPPGTVVLASNDHSHVQAATVTHRGGVFWALQYHPEYDLHELARLTHCRREALVNEGRFADLAAADGFVECLEMLHEDPSRRDLAWAMGIDADVMDADVRAAEVRNWLDRLVKPSLQY